MKKFLLVIIVFHGLIHVMGFLKAFEWVEFSQLKQDISRLVGLFCLISALLFFAAAFFLIVNNSWWWLPGLITIVISQALIIMFWQDAKFGTIANVLLLISVILAFGVWQFTHLTNKEIASIAAANEHAPNKEITQERLETLPAPVEQWLSAIGMAGKNEIQSVTLKQTGLMKLEPSQKKWYKADAEQYITINKPAFLWRAHINMMPFIDVVGRDFFNHGKGQMEIKIASLFPVVNVSDNEKVHQSTLQRYLLELPWYPSAALSPYITWEKIDDFSAEATMDYNGVSGSAIYYFDTDGNVEKISALRYKDSDENAKLVECIGEVIETSTIDGIEIPTKLNVSWMLNGEKFTWYKIEIDDVEFN